MFSFLFSSELSTYLSNTNTTRMHFYLNHIPMTTKKPSQDPIELLAQYVHSVWIDFDNIKEVSQIHKVSRMLKPRKIKPKKK
jgi:hypothetical protein